MNDALIRLRDDGSEEQFRQVRVAVGKVLATIRFDILAVVYAEFPDLEPPTKD